MNENFLERKIIINQGNKRNQEKESKNINPDDYLRKNLEDLTDKCKNSERFKQTLQKLEKLAANQGFDGLLIKNRYSNICLGAYEVINELSTKEKAAVAKYPENKVLVGKYALGNIKDLFLTDEELTTEGFTEIFSHENKGHLSGIAAKLREERNLKVENLLKEEKSYDETVQKMAEIESEYSYRMEIEAEKQRLANGKKEENLDKFIEKQAKMRIVLDVVRGGFGYLRGKSYDKEESKPNYLGVIFTDSKLKNDILKQMEKMRQNLLTNYDEKLKSGQVMPQ